MGFSTYLQLAKSAWETFEQVQQQIETINTFLRPLELRSALEQHQKQLNDLHQALAMASDEVHALTAELSCYRELFDRAPGAYLITDAQGIIQAANQAAMSLLQPHLAGVPLLDLIEPSAHLKFQNLLGQLQRGQIIRRRSFKLQLEGNRQLPIVFTLSSQRDPRGKLIGLRWWVQEDLSAAETELGIATQSHQTREQNQALKNQVQRLEQQLQEERDRYRRESQTVLRNETRLRNLIDQSADILVILEADGSVQFANLALERRLGYRLEEWQGRSFFAGVHPEDISRFGAYFTQLLQGKGVDRRVIYRQRHIEGFWLTLEALGCKPRRESILNGIILNLREIRTGESGEFYRLQEVYDQTSEQQSDAAS